MLFNIYEYTCDPNTEYNCENLPTILDDNEWDDIYNPFLPQYLDDITYITYNVGDETSE